MPDSGEAGGDTPVPGSPQQAIQQERRGAYRAPRLFVWLNLLGFAAGVAAITYLTIAIGPRTLWEGLVALGAGFVLTSSMHLSSLLCDAVTLKAAAGVEGQFTPYRVFAKASLCGHAVNEATPLGKLGEVTKFSLLSQALAPSCAASALIVQNFVMFLVNCTLMTIAPLTALAIFEVSYPVDLALAICAGVFAFLGVACLLLMYRGVGDLPLSVARLFKVSAARLERWQDAWSTISGAWHEVVKDRRYMRAAWVSGFLSRCLSVAELATILWFLGLDPQYVIIVGAVNLASTQVIAWVLVFVPMQAGTSEGGAYLLFSGLGLVASLGVLLELVRKMRRLVMIAIGVSWLGWSEFKRATERPGQPPSTATP